MKNKINFFKNENYQGRVQDLTHEALGVVKLDGYPFFVEGALPGELVQFKAVKVGKKFGYGKLLEVLEESPERVELTDKVGRQTGTMTLQHMTYAAQLEFKRNQVKNVFERIGKFEGIEIQPTVGMDEPWQYRNKAQIPVREIGGQLETGFYRKNSHDLIPVEDFYIQHPEIDQAIVQVRDILREYDLAPYDELTHTGLIRHVIVRRGYYSGQLMIILVTNGKKVPDLMNIIEDIIELIPNVVSIIQNINNQKTNVILGKKSHVLWGQDYYEDQMLGLTFKISAQSFYQVNTLQAEKIYELVLKLAELSGEETVLDAYSGIGTISLALAQQAGMVYAMEIVPEAVEMARENAYNNKLENVIFEAGAAEEWLPKWNEEGIRFDVAVVDPPRKGLDESFIASLIEQAPERIVYVSCNPATQARDCRLFADAGYEIKYIQPVDLFAQTNHVEAVTLLTRNVSDVGNN